jgi:adenosylcobinamide-GDP ribazoletransferase
MADGAPSAATGAFHEDGLADTADGLGGGQTLEERLEIMKDSRLGTYGALALGVIVAARIAALAQLPAVPGAIAFVAAHGLARAAAVFGMASLPYVADPAVSKLRAVARDVRPYEATIGLAIALVPLAWLPWRSALCGLVVGTLAALWPALAARRLIGGHTGDVLGAIEQAFETAFLVGVAAIGLRALR